MPFLGGDHLPNFTESETQLLALQDQGKARPIALRVQTTQSLALRREKSLVLVEAQRPQRNAEVTRQLANREFNFGGGFHFVSSLAGDPDSRGRMLYLVGIIHLWSLALQ